MRVESFDQMRYESGRQCLSKSMFDVLGGVCIVDETWWVCGRVPVILHQSETNVSPIGFHFVLSTKQNHILAIESTLLQLIKLEIPRVVLWSGQKVRSRVDITTVLMRIALLMGPQKCTLH